MDYPIPLIDQLSQHLRSLRKTRCLSQAQIAKMMGVTQARVATIERDPSVVSVGQLFEMLRLLEAQFVLRDLKESMAKAGTASTGDGSTQFGTPGSKPRGEW
jgi:HTH-type transcriptional regulator/antitoxin HipB